MFAITDTARHTHAHTHAQFDLNFRHRIVCSPDAWIITLHGADFPVARFHEVGGAVKELIWTQAQAHLRRGTSVVFDFSFWTRADRTDWRQRIAALALPGPLSRWAWLPRWLPFTSHPPSVQLHYAQCAAATRRARLLHRNAHRSPSDLHISPKQLLEWDPLFEPPLEQEAALLHPCE